MIEPMSLLDGHHRARAGAGAPRSGRLVALRADRRTGRWFS
ncbi:hypothetical protein [Amycolatopsis samaneae]|uniref:Uncharacterized protein n=1 Tax=Amycolatopsis samaneae TaxID=664691 RepID=A0ABW5GDY4_9PSEU